MSKKDEKAGKEKKGKKGKGTGGGPSVANHPRARAQIRMAKGWGGLIGFVIAGLRALAAGVAGYVVAWGCAVTVWRHLVVAELRAAAEAGRVIPQAPAAEQSGS